MENYKQMNCSIYSKAVLLLFALLIIIKGLLLASYGPIYTPDSTGYTGFGDTILKGSSWLHSVDLSHYWYPHTAFRSIGYPAFISFAKIINQDHFEWIVVLGQMCLSLYVTRLVMRLSFEISQRVWFAVIAALSHGLGLGVMLDQCLLTDSLNASVLLIVICLISLRFLRKEPPTYLFIFSMGLLVALAFFIREAMAQLQYLYWIVILGWVFAQRLSLKKSVIVCLVFGLPMMGSIYSYKSWNEYRTGERFITTAGQTTMYFPALDLKKRGINAFENDVLLKDLPAYKEPLAKIAPLKNISIINTHLVKEHGMSPIDVSRYAFKKFVGYWREFPLEMLKITLSHIPEEQAFQAFMPVESMMLLDYWATNTKPYYQYYDLMLKVTTEARYDLFTAYIARFYSHLFSIVVMAAFVFGAPLMFLSEMKNNKYRISEIKRSHVLFLMFWLLYFGYTSAYALVNLEMRYLLPVQPFCMIAGLYFLINPIEKYWAEMRKPLA